MHFQMLTLIFTMMLTGSLARFSAQTNAVIGPRVRTEVWLGLRSTVSCNLKFTVILFAELITGVNQTSILNRKRRRMPVYVVIILLLI